MSGCQPTNTESNAVDALVIHSMRQTIEMWQKGCEVLISDLQGRIRDIEYRLEHIISLPSELDIRLQDVERQLDKSQDYGVEFRKRLDKLESVISILDLMIKAKEMDVQMVVNERLGRLEEQIKELERNQNITNEQYKFMNREKKPHKCPVCHGEGRIELKEPLRKGNTTYFSISCVSCKEKGIIWG